jgi:hypothetical protein
MGQARGIMKLSFGPLATAAVTAALLACGGDDTPGAAVNPVSPPAGGAAATSGAGATAGTTAGATPGAGMGATGRAGTGATPGAGTGATPAAGTGATPAAGTGAMPGAGTGAMPGAGTGAVPGADAGPMTADAAPPTGTGGATCGGEVMHSPTDLGDMTKFGQFMPAHVENTGPNGSSWIFHPAELGKDGLKHPVFQWGPGAGTGPVDYEEHLSLLASHGFVIISQASTQSGREALDWILAENDKEGSMWHQKLDPMRVGRGGHSMGALQSMSEADDDRLTLYVLVCGGAGGGGGADDIDEPTIILGGEGLGDTTNFEGDYAEMTGPSVFIRHGNTSHILCARDNMAPWVAFMRWQFCGEEKWKKEFEAGGTYCMGAWAECETKNL